MGLESLEERRVLDADAELFFRNDLIPSPGESAWLNGELFFAADDGTGDVELWKSDGTTQGTQEIKDIRPGRQGSFPMSFVAADDRIYFTAYDDEAGRELWSTDGTESGTQRVIDLNGSPDDSLFGELAVVGRQAFFQHQGELWATDGTAVGTRLVKDIFEGERGSYPSQLTVGDGLLYFNARSETGLALWSSDGSIEGTSELLSSANRLLEIAFVEDGLFVLHEVDDNTQLLKFSDATPAPTVVHDFGLGGGDLFALGEQLFVIFAPEASGSRELWVSRGTSETMVEIAGLPFSRFANFIGALGNEVIFEWSGGVWRSNGTAEETQRVSEISARLWNPATGSESLFFTAEDDATGVELHILRDDGVSVVDVVPGPASSNATVISAEDDRAFFWVGSSGGLWTADSNTATVELIHPGLIGPTDRSGQVKPLAGNEALFFSVDNEFTYDRNFDIDSVLLSDGSPASTRAVASSVELSLETDELILYRDQVYFVANYGEVYRGLFEASATLDQPRGIMPLDGILEDVTDVVVVDDVMYLSAWGEETGWGLWRTDGTAEGTNVVFDHPDDVPIRALAEWQGRVAFLVEDGEIWLSDRSTNATSRIADLPSIQDVHLIPAGDNLFIISDGDLFVANVDEYELVQLSASYVHASNIAVLDNTLFFSQDIDGLGREPWTSDGTVLGTRLLSDLAPGPDGSDPWRFTRLGDSVIFQAMKAETNSLWKTDGTPEGTSMFFDDLFLYGFGDVREVDGVLYFAGDQSKNAGAELWRTDGTEAGTFQLTDIAPGTRGSDAKYTTEVNGYLYFQADDGFHGPSLWRLPIDPLPGDLDGNGEVDFADFLVLSSNVGKAADVLFRDGDLDGNGEIDFLDFLKLSENFGKVWGEDEGTS